MEEKVPLSVVIITKNEQERIAECLESVSWVNDIIVLDDMSTDNTVEICKKYTDRIISRKMDVEGTHRNYGYSLAANEWVLSLDSDERVTSELKQEIIDLLKSNSAEFAAYTIPRRNYIGDCWLKNGGWYPSAQLRLFKKDKFKYEEVDVHPRAFLDGECGHLKADMLHYSYRDFGDFLIKLNGQTTKEAKKWVDDNRKMSLVRAIRKTLDRFLKAYLIKKGYKDGFYGFMAAYFAGLYQLISYAKYWEIKNQLRTIN